MILSNCCGAVGDEDSGKCSDCDEKYRLSKNSEQTK